VKKLFLGIALIVLLIGVGFYIVQRESKKSASQTTSLDYIKEGDTYLSKKEYSKALEQYKLAINTDPTYAESYIKASDIYILKSNDSEALDLLQKGIPYVVNPDEIYSRIGIILFDQEDIQGAVDALEKSQAINPHNPKSAKNLIKAYIYFPEKKDKAITILSELDISGSEDDLWKNYYLALLSIPDTFKVIQYIDTLKFEGQTDIEVNIKSLQDTVHTIQANPDNKIKNNALFAYELIKAEFYPIALPLLDEIISENDEYYASYMYEGICYLQMKNYDKAVERLSKATVIAPTELQPWIFLAESYVLSNNQQLAIESYEQALALDKTQEQVQYDYAKTLVHFGLYTQAKLEYKKLIELKNTNEMKYKIELSLIDLDYGNEIEEGFQNAKEVVDNWDGFQTSEKSFRAEALDALGWAFDKKGEKDNALKYISEARDIDPSFALAYYHLGYIYVKIENFSEAQMNLERAIDLDLTGDVSAKARIELDHLPK
jgi:tetratricopeptide (TPR) repeat protein